VRVWIDIENPPQVQFLLPFDATFRSAGADVVITARESGITLDLLRESGAHFNSIGAHYGKSRRRKVVGMLGRTRALLRFLTENERPNVLLCASRAAALAARVMGCKAFILSDYEHSDLTVYRWTRSSFLYPDVISADSFMSRGIRSDRLLPFRGLKEDISFAGVDLDAVQAHSLPVTDRLVKVLFRPPAEESHYYRSESGELTRAALHYLARSEEAVVVFSPRYDWQASALSDFSWRHKPIELTHLGIPAYSIFRGRIGGVDRHLAAQGRLRIVETPSDLSLIDLRPRRSLRMLRSNPGLLSELVELIASQVEAGHQGAQVPDRRERARTPSGRFRVDNANTEG
jgi:predicted glycosyltransferase